MCGLLGLAFSRDADLRSRLSPALATLEHRGPDGEGMWADEDVWLGHRRLAIIDLNARSDQPMVDEETGNVLVFNGEIYNYRELRTELEAVGARFRTSSDTEVLLKAYRHWGPAAFERMNGMWAVAIWHPRERRLFLCRDRFGVKPLYYAQLGKALAFASEPKALFAIAPELAEPNPAAIARLVVSSESFATEDTYVQRIWSVPPASWAFVSGGESIQFRRFWHYPDSEVAQRRSPAEEVEEFGALFESAVRLRLRSDVPVGLTLSGGLDSTAILAATRSNGFGGLRAFSATFGQGDESAWARTAAEQADVPLVTVDSEAGNWLERLQQITWHMDAPGFSPPVFPLWNIMQKARQENVPVLLEGQGADELFGGYVQYAAAHVLHQFALGNFGNALKSGPSFGHTFGFHLLAKWMARLIFEGQYRNWQHKSGRGSILTYPQECPRISHRSGSRFDPFELMRTDHAHSILPSLLHYGDAISMAHGIESRLPFLDYRLVQWVFKNRPSIYENRKTKSPIRSYLRGRHFHAHAARRDKKGFTTPTHTWMTKNKNWINSNILENHNARLWEYVKRGEAAKLLRPTDYFSASHGYKLLTIQIWLDNLANWRTAKI